MAAKTKKKGNATAKSNECQAICQGAVPTLPDQFSHIILPEQEEEAQLDVVAPLRSQGCARFQLHERLGVGGMCEVFLATDLVRTAWGDDKPQVVIKKLLPALATNPQAKLSLAHEFFTLRYATHTGVMRVFDLHQQEDELYLSMEYLRGETVYDMLAEYGIGLGLRSATFATELLDAITYLHGHGIVHGDIKPSNLILTHERRLVLFDFNMAQLRPVPGSATATISLGLRESLALPSYSPLYSSPERIESKTPSYADDVYACCCTVYEMYTGQHPFQRLTSVEAKEKGLTAHKPKHMPHTLWKQVRQGLSFQPECRPSAEALLREFRKPHYFGQLTSLIFE